MESPKKMALLPLNKDHPHQDSRLPTRWLSPKILLQTLFLCICGFLVISAKYPPFTQIRRAPLTEATKLNSNNMCQTPECIQAASQILENLNPNHDEWDFCRDFEGTVCQGFREHHELRPDQGETYQAILMKERFESEMRHVLDTGCSTANTLSSPEEDADRENFAKLQDVYSACVNDDRIRDVGFEPLKALLTRLDGQKTTSEALLFLAKLGVTPLVDFGAGPDQRDPDAVVAYVWPPRPGSVGLPAKEFYDDDGIFEKYINVVKNVLCHSTTWSSKGASYLSIVDRIVEFEKELAHALPEREEMGNITKTYDPKKLSDADELVPLLHLPSLLRGLSPKGALGKGIILEISSYFKKLNCILSETPDDTVRAYLKWKTIQHFASAVESEAISPWKQLLNELSGKNPTSAPERWRTCLQIVDDGLGWLLSRLFVQQAFHPSAKRFAEEIVSDVQNQWVSRLEDLTWMEPEVKARAVTKARQIAHKIGYPIRSPDVMDPVSLQNYYEPMNVSRFSHFENVVNIGRFKIELEWSTLGKPWDWDVWSRPATTINAWYDPTGNEVNFPAGLLQLPIFSPSLPQYLSYGGFGSIAGHELSHAFDETGRQVDETGNLTDWWTPKTVEAFRSRAQCFIPQYEHFAIAGPEPHSILNVSGTRTLNENIADAGGMGAAFKAWKARAAREPKEANMDLPGLGEFSHDQLFFIGFANWFCSASTKAQAIKRIYTDSHAPMWVRVLGTTRNSREFKEAFGCPVKEPVCELW